MNYVLLKYTLGIKRILVKDICKKLKISRSAWNRKTNGLSEFTRDEIQELINILDLTQQQIKEIFFSK